MPFSPHTPVHSLPKEAPELTSLFDTSLSTLQLEVALIPRYWKVYVLSSFVLMIMMFSCEGTSPGAGYRHKHVFCKHLVRPKALVAIDRYLASSCRSGSFRAARAHLCAKRTSCTKASKTALHQKSNYCICYEHWGQHLLQGVQKTAWLRTRDWRALGPIHSLVWCHWRQGRGQKQNHFPLHEPSFRHEKTS